MAARQLRCAGEAAKLQQRLVITLQHIRPGGGTECIHDLDQLPQVTRVIGVVGKALARPRHCIQACRRHVGKARRPPAQTQHRRHPPSAAGAPCGAGSGSHRPAPQDDRKRRSATRPGDAPLPHKQRRTPTRREPSAIVHANRHGIALQRSGAGQQATFPLTSL